MSGGVRNLRAMFENKDQSTSPPDRGRSPAGSNGGGSNGTSPRPLSKVRTSFVAVERSGQIGNQLGLKRDTSGEPSTSKRRPSHSIDEELQPETKGNMATGPTKSNDDKQLNQLATAVEKVKEDVNKIRGITAGNHNQTKEDPKPTNAQVETKKAPAATGRNGESSKSAKPVSNGHPNPPLKAGEKEAKTKIASKPAPISITKTSASAKSSPASKQPTPKTPTTPRQGRSKDFSKVPAKQPEKKPSRASLAPSQTTKLTSKPTTAAFNPPAQKTRIGQSPPQTGFVKPKPKSPTRPVKLPASLTAHTASSGSKTTSATAAQSTTRQSLSRQSGTSQLAGSLQAYHSLSRSPSRTSTTAGSKTNLSRNPSSLRKSSSRPSLGPPPTVKVQSSRQSLSSEALPPADESFLARMARPTTSWASKTAEKVPVTPPKKAPIPAGKRPSTRDGPVKASAFGKAAVSNTSNKGVPTKSASKEVKTAAPKHKTTDVEEDLPIKNSGATDNPKRSEEVIEAKDPAPVSTEVESKTLEENIKEEKAGSERGEKEKYDGEIEEPLKEVEHSHEPEEQVEVKYKDRGLPKDEKTETEEIPADSRCMDNEPTVGDQQTPKSPNISTPLEATPSPVVKVDQDESHENRAPEMKTNGFAVGNLESGIETNHESEPEIVKTPIKPTPSESSKSDLQTPSTPTETKLNEVEEDPEDVKAREEIAKLNAELMKKAAAEEAQEVD